MDKQRESKSIYEYADRHLRDWFPRLPGYVAYVQRLNRLADVFAPLVALIQQEQEAQNLGQVWVHVIGRRQPGSLPIPGYIGVTGASEHDGKVFDQIRPQLHHNELYGDKAYQRPDAEEIGKAQNLGVLTPVKKQQGQRYLEPQDQWLSTAVSCVRQPIEALFAWIEEKTGIECVSKVRSYNGLMVHVFGKLAAAPFFWNFLRTSS